MVQCHYSPLKLDLDPIFLRRELLFQGAISRRNNINGWHRIFWRNRSSTTQSHTCQQHAEITQSHTFAALIRLSTTTHNLLTFNISEISSNNSENSTCWQVSTYGLFSYTLLIQVPGFRVTRSAGTTLALFSHQKKTPWPGQSSPTILLSPNSFDP